MNQTLGGASGGEPAFNLLVWGGVPGEWEGEHPHTVARSLDLPNVFFCGWLPHDILSEGLNLAGVLVAPSFNEPFGQVYLEAMATEMPVIATRSGGPLDFVVDGGPLANGWFCEVDDVDSLAGALHQALTDEGEGGETAPRGQRAEPHPQAVRLAGHRPAVCRGVRGNRQVAQGYGFGL